MNAHFLWIIDYLQIAKLSVTKKLQKFHWQIGFQSPVENFKLLSILHKF